eukprot:TRINITY_DN33892_c0_g1_i5.p1 TRINITY_DN33892_c0_g1~~TRINITY_DN33892_c0_g1_i5.p1  ORF type:complete len:327 (-),score=4.78 TRINITY_DN33892_c0_g1_i5:484-1326(-)
MQSEYAPNIQYTSMANNYERKKVGFPGSQPDVGTRQQLSIIREAENEGEQDFEYNYADNNQSKYNRNHMFKFSEHDSQNQNDRDGYLQNQYSPSTLQQNYQIQQIYNNIFYQQNQNNQMQYQIQTDPQQYFMSTRSYDSDFEFKNQRVLGNDLMGGQIERFLTPSILNFQITMSSGQTLGVKAQRFRGHTSPHRNVKEKKDKKLNSLFIKQKYLRCCKTVPTQQKLSNNTLCTYSTYTVRFGYNNCYYYPAQNQEIKIKFYIEYNQQQKQILNQKSLLET